MLADPLKLLPALRPWQRAGVEFLLAEHSLPAPWSLCIAAPPPLPARATSARSAMGTRPAPSRVPSAPPAEEYARSAPVSAARQGYRPAPPATSAISGPTPVTTSAPSSGFAPSAPPASGTSLPPAAGPPPALWPAVWQERLTKTAPAVVLWTYWALGEDLCLRPDPARRALLQKLLGDLGHPSGTHSFWPAALPASTASPTASPTAPPDAPQEADASPKELQANPEIFWAGVQALKARALVVMGSPALKALDLPPRLRPFQQTRHQGRLIVVLRDVDFLAKESHRYDAVREFLKQALAPFGRA